MKTRTFCTTALMLALSASIAYASPIDADAIPTTASYSTSADALPAAPAADTVVATPAAPMVMKKPTVKPFTHPGVAVKVGINGIGFDVALPLARKFNIRGGASFFSLSHTFTSDGTSYNASLDFKSSQISLDWYPFGGAFRLSPVLQIYNGNTVTASLSEPAAATGSFSLGDTDYYSSTSRPVGGSAVISLGNSGGSKVAPGVTLGWGNMIPRGKSQHWSVPFEMGVVFIQAPQAALSFQGVGCTNQADAEHGLAANVGSCVDLGSNATAISNIQQQQADVNNDLSGLKVFPILSVGLSYKF